MEKLGDFTQFGVAGLAIGALVFVVASFLKFMREYILHNTRSNENLASSIEGMQRTT